MVPLAPEFVTPQDGSVKQDCELNASRRWLQRHGAHWANFGAVVLGDDLYCHEPFCRALRAQGLDFVLDWLDASFVQLRERVACRRRLFDDIRALTTYAYFPSWSAMIEFMILSLSRGRQPFPAPP